jgi:lipopolysaccharide transport system permease protein
MDAGENKNHWTLTIRPASGWFDLDLSGVWCYRDLIMLFVRRDFVSIYKQTILGPLWYLIQPLMMTLVFTIVFGKIANISTDGLPHSLFYLSGIVMWRYFADCLDKTSNTFVANAGIFGKVYFPRLCVPVSVVISNLLSLAIQLALFLLFWLYYYFNGLVGSPTIVLLVLPLLILQMAALGLGCGIIVSSLTTKYRDLNYLVGFGVQLWMYATPVVYPASAVPEHWRWLLALNPMTSIVEMFRHAFFGTGVIDLVFILPGIAITFLILVVGILLFSRVEKSFMDTV